MVFWEIAVQLVLAAGARRNFKAQKIRKVVEDRAPKSGNSNLVHWVVHHQLVAKHPITAKQPQTPPQSSEAPYLQLSPTEEKWKICKLMNTFTIKTRRSLYKKQPNISHHGRCLPAVMRDE